MTIPLPEIKVTDKTIPVLESLGVCLGPNAKWLEDNSEVARRAYEEMIAERDLAMPSAEPLRVSSAGAASPSNRFAFRPSGLPSVSQEKST